MRKIKFFKIFLALAAFSLIASCSGDNEPIDPSINVNSQTQTLPVVFKAGIGGKTFTTSQVTAVFEDGNVTIFATRGTEQESIQIKIKGNIVGTYQANTSVIGYRAGVTEPLFSSVNPADSSVNTGKITISSVNNVNDRISGTFECTSYNNNGSLTLTKEITNGVFTNIPFTIN